MAKTTNANPAIDEIKTEEMIVDENKPMLCRMCLKSKDIGFTECWKILYILEEVFPDNEIPFNADEYICASCYATAQSVWQLRRKMANTNQIWEDYNLKGQSFSVEPGLLLQCHLCPIGGLTQQDLKKHITSEHDRRHFNHCEHCKIFSNAGTQG